MVLDREAQGLAAAAAQLSQPETSAACSSGGQHSSPSAEGIQGIYSIIGMQVRAIMPSEATVCARGSETYIFPPCCIPGLTLLLHSQLVALQHLVAWVCSTLPSTHQKHEMKT